MPALRSSSWSPRASPADPITATRTCREVSKRTLLQPAKAITAQAPITGATIAETASGRPARAKVASARPTPSTGTKARSNPPARGIR